MSVVSKRPSTVAVLLLIALLPTYLILVNIDVTSVVINYTHILYMMGLRVIIGKRLLCSVLKTI